MDFPPGEPLLQELHLSSPIDVWIAEPQEVLNDGLKLIIPFWRKELKIKF